jgi:hypothetical protein
MSVPDCLPSQHLGRELECGVVCLPGHHDRPVAAAHDKRLVPVGVTGRRDDEHPGQRLGLAVELDVLRAGRVDQLGQGVSAVFRAVANSLRCTNTGKPATNGLPPQWSKCKWQLTTRSTSLRSAPTAASASGRARLRGRLCVSSSADPPMPVSNKTTPLLCR